MIKRNNGRSFEKLVAIIQEAYKDVPSTKIYTNHKIEDRVGRKREFDVFIVTKVNNIDFRIAIECKDYKSPVPVEKIEAFNSKCSTVSNINKKIIFSSKGFQSAAVANAKLFDIELATLRDIKKVAVPFSRDKNYNGFLNIKYQIIDYEIIVQNEIFGKIGLAKTLLNDQSYLAHVGSDPMHPISFIERELYKGLRPEMFKPIQVEAMKHGVLVFERDWVIDDSFTFVVLKEHPLNLIFSGKELPVIEIKISAKLHCKSVSDDSNAVVVKAYNDSTDSKKGELFSVNFAGEERTQFYYKFLDTTEDRMVAVDGDKTVELTTQFTIDTSTGEFIPSHTNHDSK